MANIRWALQALLLCPCDRSLPPAKGAENPSKSEVHFVWFHMQKDTDKMRNTKPDNQADAQKQEFRRVQELCEFTDF